MDERDLFIGLQAHSSNRLNAQEGPVKPRLMAISGSLQGSVRHLIDGQISIGRGDTNHFCLKDSCGLTQALHDPASRWTL